MVCLVAMLTLSKLRLAPQAEVLPTLEFAPGQIHVILGRNRSGKTGLCRLLAGLPSQAQAEIRMNGSSWSKLGPRERSVALVYQAFINYPHWSVARNIASPLQAQGLAPAEVAARVEDLAARLELTDLLDRLPDELSGGQQQRVAIGRALAKGGELLLLDEPLVNLDYKLREVLEDELLDLLRSTGATVLYTSSDPKDALGLADNVLLLDDHRVVQQGPPLELYQHPNSAIAADLLSDPGVNRLPADAGLRFVRPEHLVLRDQLADPEQPGLTHFSMQVTALETNGSHSYVHGQVAGEPWIAKLDGLPSFNLDTELGLVSRTEDLLSLPNG